jgi:hypothetical protein
MIERHITGNRRDRDMLKGDRQGVEKRPPDSTFSGQRPVRPLSKNRESDPANADAERHWSPYSISNTVCTYSKEY